MRAVPDDAVEHNELTAESFKGANAECAVPLELTHGKRGVKVAEKQGGKCRKLVEIGHESAFDSEEGDESIVLCQARTSSQAKCLNNFHRPQKKRLLEKIFRSRSQLQIYSRNQTLCRIAGFRQSRLTGDFFFAFRLHVVLRKGFLSRMALAIVSEELGNAVDGVAQLPFVGQEYHAEVIGFGPVEAGPPELTQRLLLQGAL